MDLNKGEGIMADRIRQEKSVKLQADEASRNGKS